VVKLQVHREAQFFSNAIEGEIIHINIMFFNIMFYFIIDASPLFT